MIFPGSGQCYDTVGWVTRMASGHVEQPAPFIPKGSSMEQSERKKNNGITLLTG